LRKEAAQRDLFNPFPGDSGHGAILREICFPGNGERLKIVWIRLKNFYGPKPHPSDLTVTRGRPLTVETDERTISIDPAGVMAMACFFTHWLLL
jgi:hypothetical protein